MVILDAGTFSFLMAPDMTIADTTGPIGTVARGRPEVCPTNISVLFQSAKYEPETAVLLSKTLSRGPSALSNTAAVAIREEMRHVDRSLPLRHQGMSRVVLKTVAEGSANYRMPTIRKYSRLGHADRY